MCLSHVVGVFLADQEYLGRKWVGKDMVAFAFFVIYIDGIAIEHAERVWQAIIQITYRSYCNLRGLTLGHATMTCLQMWV